jgi:hypothetical protein
MRGKVTLRLDNQLFFRLTKALQQLTNRNLQNTNPNSQGQKNRNEVWGTPAALQGCADMQCTCTANCLGAMPEDSK